MPERVGDLPDPVLGVVDVATGQCCVRRAPSQQRTSSASGGGALDHLRQGQQRGSRPIDRRLSQVRGHQLGEREQPDVDERAASVWHGRRSDSITPS